MFKRFIRYVDRVILGLDQFGNTLLGGFPDETISARAGRLRDKNPVAKVTSDVLDKIQKDHVELAQLHERDGSQQDPAYADVYDPEDYGFIIKEKD